jgi:hypothetical protein
MDLGTPETLDEMWRRFYDIACLTHPDSGGVADDFDVLMECLPMELSRFSDEPHPFKITKRPSLRDIYDVAFGQAPCMMIEEPTGIDHTSKYLSCADIETSNVDPTTNYSIF